MKQIVWVQKILTEQYKKQTMSNGGAFWTANHKMEIICFYTFLPEMKRGYPMSTTIHKQNNSQCGSDTQFHTVIEEV